MRLICFGQSYCIPINRSIERWISSRMSWDITCVGPSSWPGDLRPLTFEGEEMKERLQAVGVPVSFPFKVQIFNYKRSAVARLLQKGWDGAYLWQEPYCRATLILTRQLRALKIPYVFFTAQNLGKSYPWPFSAWEQEVVNNCSGWIACGKSVLNVQNKRGYPVNKGIILPHAVNTKLFKPAEQKDKEKLWKNWGLFGPVIGYVGRLTPEKGIRTILKVLETLSPNCWGGTVFLGSGPLENDIKIWARGNGWQDKVVVRLVKHSDMPLELPGLDVLIAPSQTTTTWREQFGRMLIEAMASGVPVISSDSGEIPHTVGDAGLIIPESDVAGFAKALSHVLESSQLQEELRGKGLIRSRLFSVETLAPQYAAFWAKSFCN